MSEIFCVQDRTGTAAQLVLNAAPTEEIEVGDTGVYTGRDWQGLSISLDFTVGAVNDQQNICITTMTPTGGSGDVSKSNWPREGTITWLTGANSASSPDSTVVDKKYAANAYITVEFFLDYHDSRGNTFPASPVDPIRRSIVKASDYLDQKFRYKGTKLLQYLSQSNNIDVASIYLDPWLSPFAFGGVGFGLGGSRGVFTPSHTSQHREWPRADVVDFNGDTVFGVPTVIMEACAEAAIRDLNGTVLQPDFDTDIVSNGGVIQSFSNEVGPIKESKTFDTKLGLGFFPDIPQIRRMLSKAGVLRAGGGRTITR